MLTSVTPRKHVSVRDWADKTATDFWFSGSSFILSGTTPEGWRLNGSAAQVTNASQTADFLSSSDRDGPYITSTTSADYIVSPMIFGDNVAADAIQAAHGWTPTKLIAEFRAAFSTNSANETASRVGLGDFVNSSNTRDVASIYSNGTNFLLQSSAASDTGAAIDTTFHTWKIVVGSNVEWFIDGASQGTIALIADKWPVTFGFYVSTTNRIRLSFAHIWYE